MTEVRHHESINRSPSFVFAAGLDTANWPDLDRLSLEARTALLAHGTDIDATVSELGQHIPLPCSVTELDPGRRLAIVGESDQAWLSLELDFAPSQHSLDTTEVDTLLKLEIRSFFLRRAFGRVASHIATTHLRNFGEGFKANIEALPADYVRDLEAS